MEETKRIVEETMRNAIPKKELSLLENTKSPAYKMMLKMGWSGKAGLGAQEEGDTDFIKLKNKRNNLGVGVQLGVSTLRNWERTNAAFDDLIRAKTVKNYSEEDLLAILGQRPNQATRGVLEDKKAEEEKGKLASSNQFAAPKTKLVKSATIYFNNEDQE
eukprot:gene181-217_t